MDRHEAGQRKKKLGPEYPPISPSSTIKFAPSARRDYRRERPVATRFHRLSINYQPVPPKLNKELTPRRRGVNWPHGLPPRRADSASAGRASSNRGMLPTNISPQRLVLVHHRGWVAESSILSNVGDTIVPKSEMRPAVCTDPRLVSRIGPPARGACGPPCPGVRFHRLISEESVGQKGGERCR